MSSNSDVLLKLTREEAELFMRDRQSSQAQVLGVLQSMGQTMSPGNLKVMTDLCNINSTLITQLRAQGVEEVG